MFCLFIQILIWAFITFLFSQITPNNLWFLFLWIPLGLLATIILFFAWLYAVVLPIFQHISLDSKWNKLKNAYTIHVLKMVNFCCGVILNVENKELLVKENRVLFVSNHKSQIDPCLIYASIGRPCAIAAKSTLWKVGPLKPMFSTFHILKINRDNNREAVKSIIEGINLLKNNNPVIIFPEGGIKTREVEQMVSLKAGAYKLATKSNAIIQPIAIIGSSKMKGRKFYQWKKITIRFLPPIYPKDYEGLNTHEIGYKVIEEVNSNFKNEINYGIKEEM